MGRDDHPLLVLLAGLLVPVLLTLGCASAQETPAQKLAAERWEKCRNSVPGVQLKEIRPDGQIWVWVIDSGRGWRECEARAAAEQRSRRAVAGAEPPPASTTSPPPRTADSAGALGSVPMPNWEPGDEWTYRYEDRASAGTFVWAMDRKEALGGSEHYVIRAGSREIFYRASDGAMTLQKVSGRVVNRYTPGVLFIAWPLAVGKAWESRFTEEKPDDRQTEEVARACVAEKEEMVSVPAGPFRAIVVACRNLRNDVVAFRIWYSPEVRHIVKEISGARVRELIAYKLHAGSAKTSIRAAGFPD